MGAWPACPFVRIVYPLFFLALASTVSSACTPPPQEGGEETQHSVIPVDANWSGVRPWQIDISDDGQYVVYQANRGDGWKLFVHRMGDPEAREVSGLGDTPYFAHISPNNEWLFFGKKAWMWKAPLFGGEMTKIWGGNPWIVAETDSTIIARIGNTLRRVRTDGSFEFEELAGLETTSGATTYHRPALLPDGKGALVSVGFGTGLENRQIGIISFSDGQLTTIPEHGINPRYSESGHILYTDGSTLKAIPFDLESLQATGEPATIIEGVHVLSNLASEFDISKNGVLVYVPGPYQAGQNLSRTLVWVDRDGNETLFDTMEKAFGVVRISPNRVYVAAEAGVNLYVFSRRSGIWNRIAATSVTEGAPVWAHDSRSLFYTRGGALGRQPVDEYGEWGEWQEILPAESRFWATSLSEDGDRILGTAVVQTPEQWQMASASTAGSGGLEPMLSGDGLTRRNPVVSPDGRWLAFVEKEGGLDRIYVQPYPDGGEAVLVSEGAVGEAAEPEWGRRADELFYRDASHIVSVRLETTPELRVLGRTPLFSVEPYYKYLNTFATVYDYDPATDRFLMVKWSIPWPPGTDIHVVEDAFEMLNRLAPAGG